jgi:hypothetical protein
LCPPITCFLQYCDPADGLCKDDLNDPTRATQCNNDPDYCSPSDCENQVSVPYCSYQRCTVSRGITTCGTPIPIDCLANRPNSNNANCYTGIQPNDTMTTQGCRAGHGCEYIIKDCGIPEDPCQEIKLDPTTTACCQLVPKDCAGRFGNAPGYTYSCVPEGGVGVCRATPHAH